MLTVEEQTKLLNQLREMFQSIAIVAVRIQDNLGNPDAVSDALVDIQSDFEKCEKINAKLGGYYHV